jgi:hypothetical protein
MLDFEMLTSFGYLINNEGAPQDSWRGQSHPLVIIHHTSKTSLLQLPFAARNLGCLWRNHRWQRDIEDVDVPHKITVCCFGKSRASGGRRKSAVWNWCYEIIESQVWGCTNDSLIWQSRPHLIIHQQLRMYLLIGWLLDVDYIWISIQFRWCS